MENLTKTEKREKMVYNILTATALLALPLILYLIMPHAFAETNASKVINVIVKVFRVTAIIAGVILILWGLFSFGMAHANQNGPDEAKARGMIIGGVVLTLLFGFIVSNGLIDDLIKVVDDEIEKSSGSTESSTLLPTLIRIL